MSKALPSGTEAHERAVAPDVPDAACAISEILDQPPALGENAVRGGTRMTERWHHGEFHAHLPGMETHVLMTYYGAAQDSSWRQGARRMSARTRPGTITLIPEGQDGHWEVAGPIEVSHVYLTDERLQSASAELAKGQRVELIGRICFDDPVSSRILQILSHEATNGGSNTSLFAEQALDLLCAQLLRCHSAQSAPTPIASRKGLADWQVKRVTGYMTDFIDQEIHLDDLAALVNLSRFHFCAAFKLATGQTPHEWLTALRMTQAQHYLAQTELPITSIALAVGYQTPAAFAASFRKRTGKTPSAYRQAC